MDRQLIRSPRETAGWAASVRSGNFVFVSGQSGTDADGTLADGIVAQTEQALRNVADVLEAAGAGFDSMLRTKVFVRDFALFPEVNDVYGRAFAGDARAARSSVQPTAMAGPQLVTIEAIANVASKRHIVTPGMQGRRPGVAADVRGGELVVLGGVVGNVTWESSDWQYPSDVAGQTRQMMENLERRLSSSGLTMGHVTRVLLLLNDNADLEVVDEIYRQWFRAETLPARIVLEQPSMLPMFKELVEIYAFASPVEHRSLFLDDAAADVGTPAAVRAGAFTFVSGLAGRGAGGQLDDSVRAQTEQAVDNLASALDAAGSGLDRLVRVLLVVSDVADLSIVNDVCTARLDVVGLPSCTAVQMRGATDGARVTIDAIAIG